MPSEFRSLLRRGSEGAPRPAETSDPAGPPDAAAIDAAPTSITADAFGVAGVVTFRIATDGRRLVDVLNEAAASPTHAEGNVALDPDELLVVVPGPRVSDPAKRLHRPGRAVEIKVGPWQVEGNAHGPPAADIIGFWMRYRPRFVAFTEAILREAGESAATSHDALLVNIRMAENAKLKPIAGDQRPKSGQAEPDCPSTRIDEKTNSRRLEVLASPGRIAGAIRHQPPKVGLTLRKPTQPWDPREDTI